MSGCYPDEKNLEWMELVKGEVVLQFYIEENRKTQLSGTIYLNIDDNLYDLSNKIKKSHPLEWEPEIMDYGQLEFGLKDPNGYIIAIANSK